jgi:hypothetical protein
VLLSAAPASASGSGTIAGAPTAAYGQQEFGNTQTDSQTDCIPSIGPISWWLLPATAGDRITIDFESTGQIDFFDQIFPLGTNDFNFAQANAVVSTSNTGGRGESVFTASRSGIWPFQFSAGGNCNHDGGPYDFIAYVLHEVVLAVGTQTSSRMHRTTVTTGLHTPDGTPINDSALTCSVQRLSHHRFLTVARSAPPCRSTVNWNRALRGTQQTLRVQVSAPNYRTTSKTLRIRAL